MHVVQLHCMDTQTTPAQGGVQSNWPLRRRLLTTDGSKMLSQIGRWDRLGRGVWEVGPEIYCKTQAGGAVHHQVKQLCWGRAADDSIAYFSMV